MNADTGVAERYTGSSVPRKEDSRLLTGRGRYVDDIDLPGMVHAVFLRSPFAHARITRIDTQEARRLNGVTAVFTGAEIEGLLTPGIYGQALRTEAFYDFTYPRHSCLATDKVRMVGDPVALVVAESRYIAEDAAELIEVDYDDLPPVPTAEVALDPSSHPLFEELGSNVFLRDEHRYGDVERVFGQADNVLEATISLHRQQNCPMEARGCIASYDRRSQRLVVHSANQGVAVQRDTIAARLGIEPERIQVVAADVGGSFGLKIAATREDVAVAAAAIELGVPVKYIEDRFEHLMTSGQAREESFDVQVAYSDQGDIQGLKVHMVIDGGAYPGIAAGLPYYMEAMLPGPYKVEAFEFGFASVMTNKATYVSYRGPWAAETFVRERIIDLVARELGADPTDIRLRNLVVPEDGTEAMITGRSLRGITTSTAVERVARTLDLDGFRRRQAAAAAEGRHLGLGIAAYIEAAPGPKAHGRAHGAEPMHMHIDEHGKLILVTGQMPHGQGHETTLAQVAADQLGIALDDVTVVFGDSDLGAQAMTGGSRSATMAGGAALTTARALKVKVVEAAAGVLEADPADITVTGGAIFVAGVPSRGLTFSDLAAAVYETDADSGSPVADLAVDGVYDGGEGGWSGGAHGVVVEVDVGTGRVSFERYVVAEDCGELINPAVVDGQIRGGIAQGIGAVLLERAAYDEDGNYLAATFMDYLLPTATDVPPIEIMYLEPELTDPEVNFRGVGEGGMIVAPAAVCNAIEDALAPLGVRIHEQHLPPVRIVELTTLAGF